MIRTPGPSPLFLILGTLLLFMAAPASASPGWFAYTEPLRTTQMAFPENGIVSAIYVEEGDEVQTGDLLARLNTAILEEERNIVREQMNLQELRLRRLQEIAASGRSLSPDELERAEVDFRIEKLRLARLEAQLDNRSLFAPFAGTVKEIHRELGESSSGTDTTILTLVQLQELQTFFYLPPALIDPLEVGALVPLQLDDGREVSGRIAFISPTIDAASGTIRVRVLIDNTDLHYRSGQGCRLLLQPPDP